MFGSLFCLQSVSPFPGGQLCRLLHSPSLVALGLSVGYETWLPIGWHHTFVINWSKYRFRLPQMQWIVGSNDWLEFLPFFRGHWQSPCTALTAGKCLPLGLCRETVKASTSSVIPRRTAGAVPCQHIACFVPIWYALQLFSGGEGN